MIQALDKWYKKIMSLYDKCMKAGLKIPFVKVEKEKYLRGKFPDMSDADFQRVLIERPSTVISLNQVKSLAKNEVWHHALLVTILSTILALPSDGFLMWTCIFADFIQFQLLVFILLQKLLYLYGCKKLTNEEGDLDSSADWILLLISTVMIGKHQMIRIAKSAAGVVVKQTIQRFAVRMLTKFMVFNLLRQIAKWFGIVLTKEMIVADMELIVPIVCAIISGLISLWLFMPMMNRLQLHLTKLTEDGKDPVESAMEIY